MGWLRKPITWLRTALRSVLQGVLVGWGALAIYFSNLPWPSLRSLFALTFAAFGVWALWFTGTRRSVTAFLLVFGGVLIWWATIEPSHMRSWRQEVAVMPRASIQGDRVRFDGVRNFDYRSTDDFTPRYETREVSLSRLKGVDFYISYWMPGPIGHTFVSFVFDDVPPLAISIEARPEVGEGYAPVASLFKQFELIYVVGEERDIVGVRTNHRGEGVYLYRVEASTENARLLFLAYIARINELADQAEFYHLLSNSCTINIVRYANTIGGSGRFDIRHYLNGLFDAYLFDLGMLDASLPFEELRRRSHINDAARAAGSAPDFPARIRASLPPSQNR